MKISQKTIEPRGSMVYIIMLSSLLQNIHRFK